MFILAEKHDGLVSIKINYSDASVNEKVMENYRETIILDKGKAVVLSENDKDTTFRAINL